MTPTLLCVPLAVSTTEEAVAILESPAPPFDLAEARLDYLRNPDVDAILRAGSRPLIFTHRAARDGGNWTGDEESRLGLLRAADLAGADFIDIEIDALSQYGSAGRARRIVSYHNFKHTPPNLPDIVRQIEEGPADIVKVATLARSHADVVALLRLLRTAHKPTISLAMGPLGGITRILGPKFGAFLVFAALATGQESAPGQIPVQDMLDRYRFRDIDPETRVYFQLDATEQGPRVAGALNAAMRRAGHNGVVVPLAEGCPSDLEREYAGLPVAGVVSEGSSDPLRRFSAWTGQEPDTLLVEAIRLLGIR